MSFFKSFFAALFALIVFSILSIFLFFGWIASLSAEEVVQVSDNSVLHISFNKPISEVELEDPFGDVFPGTSAGYTGILDLVTSIKDAENDSNIEGIFIESWDIPAGPAQLEELRSALVSFKNSGKFIYAFGENMSEGLLYVASVADSIFVSPYGFFEFDGLVMEAPYFKKALDKLDIEAQIFRVGDFKDAVEPFTRSNMSEESKAQNLLYLKDIYNHYMIQIAESRNIDFDKLDNASSEHTINNVFDAVEIGLIDAALYRDQVIARLAENVNEGNSSNLNLIHYEDYRKVSPERVSTRNRIAVIVAEGTIVDGEGDNESIGSSRFVKEIRKARKNDRVKAIVLRVNSPGGSFLASDVMWRELKLAAEEKPLIASMSTYAASGGYYMSMVADTIVAYPNTITGSIGVFSIIPDLSRFMDNKLGVTFDRVKTGKNSDILTVTRPLTDFEKQIWQNQTNEVYDVFLNKAAEGRGMEVEELANIASGRVWTGNQAQENGLVDVLGNFNDALEIAANKAGIEEYKVYFYPEKKTVLEEYLDRLAGGTETMILKNKYGEAYSYLNKLNKIREIQGIQLRWPYFSQIRL